MSVTNTAARAATVLALLGAPAAMAAEADPEYGQDVFNQQCVICHSDLADAVDKSGPNLHGVFQRAAGVVEYQFGFSPAIAESGLTWDVSTLNRFLETPGQVVRGTKMVYFGLPDEQDRWDLICYLEDIKDGPSGACPQTLQAMDGE